jgi:DNA-binding NarL/FixJ family response regulator
VSAISVVIADQKKATRISYLKQLQPERGIRVVGQAGTRSEVVEAMKLRPRILLLDWKMFVVSGGSLLPLVRQQSPHTKIILLTSRASPTRIVEALSQGARGYLRRALARAFLVKAVRVVDSGEVWVPRTMVPLLLTLLSRLGLT